MVAALPIGLALGSGGAIGLVRNGDRIRIDIPNRRIDVLVGDAELAARRVEQDAKGWKPASGFRHDKTAFPLIAIILALVIAGTMYLTSSKLGRALCAIRDSEHAASASGRTG